MEVDDFRAGGFEDAEEIVPDGRLTGVADGGAGVAQLGHEGVLANHGGRVLLPDTLGGDLVIGPILELAGPGAAAAVGDGHTAEPAVGAVIAGEDAMEGHELEVVLVRPDTEVGGPADGFRSGQTIRDHEARAGVEGDHRRREGREAAATA